MSLKVNKELYVANFSDVLEKWLIQKYKAQKSSNAIEGILTSNSRLEDLMMKN